MAALEALNTAGAAAALHTVCWPGNRASVPCLCPCASVQVGASSLVLHIKPGDPLQQASRRPVRTKLLPGTVTGVDVVGPDLCYFSCHSQHVGET